jgi:hypothetical protein
VWMALLFKELRECSLYAGLALLAQIHFLGAGMDLPLIPYLSQERGQEIPFVETNREMAFATIAVIVAIVLGLHQTVWESWRQTTLFLLHRPMRLSQIFLIKLAAGGLLLLGATALPLIVYCLWAATPGTHASPFYWGMTESWWRNVVVALICYLGAFLTGLRPAHWLGSRTWPMIAVLTGAVLLQFVPFGMSFIYLSFAALMSGLVVSILETARTREFP